MSRKEIYVYTYDTKKCTYTRVIYIDLSILEAFRAYEDTYISYAEKKHDCTYMVKKKSQCSWGLSCIWRHIYILYVIYWKETLSYMYGGNETSAFLRFYVHLNIYIDTQSIICWKGTQLYTYVEKITSVFLMLLTLPCWLLPWFLSGTPIVRMNTYLYVYIYIHKSGSTYTWVYI